MPGGLHHSYGTHHLHFITCSCCQRLLFCTPRAEATAFASGLGEDFISSSCRVIETLAQTFVVPALRKVREERATRVVGNATPIKGRATRPEVMRTRFPSCTFVSFVVQEIH